VKVPATEPVKITKRPKLVGFECLLEASRRKLPFLDWTLELPASTLTLTELLPSGTGILEF